MKRPNPALVVLLASLSLTLASCAGRPVPDPHGTYHGKPVRTRASHPAGGPMHPVEGTYLGRRYFHPQGFKSGLHWIDVYGQP